MNKKIKSIRGHIVWVKHRVNFKSRLLLTVKKFKSTLKVWTMNWSRPKTTATHTHTHKHRYTIIQHVLRVSACKSVSSTPNDMTSYCSYDYCREYVLAEWPRATHKTQRSHNVPAVLPCDHKTVVYAFAAAAVVRESTTRPYRYDTVYTVCAVAVVRNVYVSKK